jgi:hypothetical protein
MDRPFSSSLFFPAISPLILQAATIVIFAVVRCHSPQPTSAPSVSICIPFVEIATQSSSINIDVVCRCSMPFATSVISVSPPSPPYEGQCICITTISYRIIAVSYNALLWFVVIFQR